MALNKDIKKVLVIGSGPIIIGQAAEFDYSGTQACQALKEEGIEVVLVNSTVNGSMYILSATSLSVIIVAGLEFTNTTSIPSSFKA